MSNPRFAEYTTSGAFSMALTRNQVAGLAMLEGGVTATYSLLVAGLERKGLCAPIAGPYGEAEHLEYRATHAGLLLMALTREAGLTNGSADPVAAELADLTAQLNTAREDARESRHRGRSAMARMQEVERELEAVKRDLALARTELETGLRLKEPPGERAWTLRLRDPRPEMSDAELRASLQEPA